MAKQRIFPEFREFVVFQFNRCILKAISSQSNNLNVFDICIEDAPKEISTVSGDNDLTPLRLLFCQQRSEIASLRRMKERLRLIQQSYERLPYKNTQNGSEKTSNTITLMMRERKFT